MKHSLWIIAGFFLIIQGIESAESSESIQHPMLKRLEKQIDSLQTMAVPSALANEQQQRIYKLRETLSALQANFPTQETDKPSETAQQRLKQFAEQLQIERDWLYANCGENPLQFSQAVLPTLKKVSEKEWTIVGKTKTVHLFRDTLTLSVQTQTFTWTSNPCGAEEIEVGTVQSPQKLSLLSAKTIDITPFTTGERTGWKIQLTDFPQAPGMVIGLYVGLNPFEEDLIIDTVAESETTPLRRIQWPKPFANTKPRPDWLSVVPHMQGMLLPSNWPDAINIGSGQTQGRSLYMSWWGELREGHGYIGMLETDMDAGIVFSHPAGGPTQIGPVFYASMGKLTYPRRIRYIFYEEANHVTLAKRYRRYVCETGRFVSLDEKEARSSKVRRLRGSPVVHTSILYHIQPESSYFHSDDPSLNHGLTSFADCTETLKQLKTKGVDKAYVHLDGWGFRGYDNLHPSYLPPNPEAGGWDGFRNLVQTCNDLGYLIATHDQYRDYYYDGANFDERWALMRENGSLDKHTTWYGGQQTLLCPWFAPGFVRRTYDGLAAHGIHLDGTYLDVFAVVEGEECHNPEHPVTREMSLRLRGQCFDLLRSRGFIMSSEEPAEWAIPHLDLVHHGPYPTYPHLGGGGARGIPIPLFNLVYHDAIYLPWGVGGKGGWGVPSNDANTLHALLNAGLPYVGLNPGEKALEEVREVCRLNEQVGRLEMINHRFLDESYRKQSTTFADGTTVTVDFDNDTWKVDLFKQ